MKYLIGAMAGLLAAALAGLAYIALGGFNAAASTPHRPPGAWILETAMERSVKARARDDAAPARFTPAQIEAGFAEFDAECVMCHGAPGMEPQGWAKGLHPPPPDLSRSARQWSAAELHWIVRHGIKLSGMPAMGGHHSEAETWNIVAFVQTLPKTTPEAYAQMRTAAQQAVREGEPGSAHPH